jgi:hypothetical protein
MLVGNAIRQPGPDDKDRVAVRVVDLARREVIFTRTADWFWASSIHLSPNGRYVHLAGSKGGYGITDFKTWDLKTGKEIATEGGLVFTPDGDSGVVRGNHGIKLIELPDGKVRWEKTEFAFLSFLPDGKRLFAGHVEPTTGPRAVVLDVRTGKELPETRPDFHSTMLLMSPDGSLYLHLEAERKGHTLFDFWEMRESATGKVRFRIPRESPVCAEVLGNPEQPPTHSFTTDGKLLLTTQTCVTKTGIETTWTFRDATDGAILGERKNPGFVGTPIRTLPEREIVTFDAEAVRWYEPVAKER